MEPRGQQGGPSTTHLARRALRHAPLALMVLAACLGLLVLVLARTSQIYRSEVVLLYRPTARPEGGGGDADSSRRIGARLQDMLLARERLRRIADERHLYPRIANREEAVDEMRRRVLFHARDGATFQITFDGATPAEAQAVTARLAQTLIDDHARQRTQEATETRKLLEAESARVAEDVKTREAELGRFLQAHPELADSAPPAGDDGRASDLQRDLERLREGNARGAGGGEGSAAALLAAVQRAETDLEQAQRDLAAKSERLTEAHPDVRAARARVQQAEAAFAHARDGLVEEQASARSGAEAARRAANGEASARADALARQLETLRRRPVARAGGRRSLRAEIELGSLRRELDRARERLAGLEQKQFEASLQAKLESSEETGSLALLDPASRPGLPAVDVRKKVGIAGLALSLLLAAGVAVLRARTDDRIYDRDDAEWLGGRPVLAVVPGRRRRV
jgi:uncharacterized protein involved in exopolysaccharide biosynthesis